MPARQHTPLSGSPMLSDLPREESRSDARHRDFDSGPVELKPKVAPRSGSFASPLRESFRESFFDLAQRYQTLRDAARRATGSKKTEPMLGANRERRLTDLPPPPPPAPRERLVTEEPPEEPTLVQPLAARPLEAVPAESERRPTTMRPPPPPDPLPRMLLPSSMPPPGLALPTNPPPPPAPPQSVWRPMLAAAALSATIGALVSGGFVALRSFSTPRATTASTSTVTPTTTPMAASTSTGPCPVGVATSGTGATDSATHTTSWSQVTASSGNTAVAASLAPTSGSPSHSSSSPAPLQVSVENLPLEGSASRLSASNATTPMRSVIHVAQPVRSVAAPPQTAAERRRAKKEAAAAAAAAQQAVAKSNDDDDDEAPKAEPPPPPAPTKGPDKAVIAKAVARAASAAMSCDSGPRSGRALITFAPSGNVQSVSLVESFGDQAVNGCVLRALGRAHVPAFAGGPVEVRKGLSW